MKNEIDLSICTCGKKIDYVKTRKPNGRMGVIVLHVDDEPYPEDCTIPEVSNEYKKWLRDLCHQTITKPEKQPEKQIVENIKKVQTTKIPSKPQSIKTSKKFSVISDVLNNQYDDIDEAMTNILEKIPTAEFSFWNESEEKTWIDIYTSNDNHSIIGKIYDGDN